MVEMKPAKLILGIGNEILTDDGIGPRLVNDLDKSRLPSDVSYLVASIGGLEILELIRDFNEVIIIDAIKTGRKKAGSVEFYTPADFENTIHLSSLHGINFLTALEMGKRTGMAVPSAIHIIAVEILEDMVFSTDFSREISLKYPQILKKVQAQLEKLFNKPGYQVSKCSIV
jgi:hydrogenase maturation protease